MRRVVIAGTFRVWHWRGRRLLAYAEHNNAMLTSAKPHVADMLRGAIGPLSVMAIGTDGTAVDPDTQTELLNEVARVSLPSAGTDTALWRNVRSGTTVSLRASFTGVDATIREMAVVGGVPSPPGNLGDGNYLDRALGGPWTVVPAETLTLEVDLGFG